MSTALVLLTLPAFAQTAAATGVIWQDRGDAASLDLANGPGGKEREPGTQLTFVKESLTGTSPKFEVIDEHGTKWKVKLGEEAKSETAAARLLWAAGYLVDEDYYRPTLRVIALPRLARGQQFVTGGNTVNDARLERDVPGADTIAWSWYDNPFVGTREFNGLRVMMALINNWDLKDINNSATRSGAGDYSIADLGATLGRTGNNLRRSKASSRDYADTIFIDTITPTHVDLRISSRPFFLSVFNFRNYRFRTRMESVGKHIPIADAQWIGERLARLSTMQIGDAFRGAGFAPADVDAYTVVVARRIAALAALGHEGKARLTAFLRMSCSSFHNIGAENPNSSPQVVPCNLKSVDAPSLHCRQSRRDHQTAQGQGGYQIRSAPRTESNEPIGTDDFHTMNQCLNAALVEECGGLPGWASAWPSAGGASRRLTGVGAPE